MRRTDPIDLQERLDDLRDEREEIAEAVAALDEGNPARPRKIQRGLTVDQHIHGLQWAVEEAHDDPDAPWSDDPAETVTLGGLTGGEHAGVQTQLQQDGDEAPERVYYVVAGADPQDCPWLSSSMTETEQFAATGQLPVDFLAWAEHVVDDRSRVGEGNGGDFAELLAAKQSASAEE